MSAVLPPPPDDDEDRREALRCPFLLGMVLGMLMLLATLVALAVRR